MKRSALLWVPAVVLSTILGFGAGWLTRDARAEDEAQTLSHQVALSQSCVSAYIASATLKEIAHGRQEKAIRLLRQNLDLALASGDRAVREGATLSEVPELNLGADRVVAYTESASYPPEQQDKARRIAAALRARRSDS
jgi:hypothetical protein